MYHTLGVNLNSWANISIQLEYLSRHLHMDRRALIFNFFNIQKVHLKCNIKYLKNNACENSYHKRKANIQRYINVDYQFKFFICWSYFIPFESLFHSSRSKTEYMHWNFNKRQEECDLEVKKKSYYRFQNLNIWDKYYKMMEKLMRIPYTIQVGWLKWRKTLGVISDRKAVLSMVEGQNSAIETCHCSLWHHYSRPPLTNCLWQLAKIQHAVPPWRHHLTTLSKSTY